MPPCLAGPAGTLRPAIVRRYSAGPTSRSAVARALPTGGELDRYRGSRGSPPSPPRLRTVAWTSRLSVPGPQIIAAVVLPTNLFRFAATLAAGFTIGTSTITLAGTSASRAVVALGSFLFHQSDAGGDRIDGPAVGAAKRRIEKDSRSSWHVRPRAGPGRDEPDDRAAGGGGPESRRIVVLLQPAADERDGHGFRWDCSRRRADVQRQHDDRSVVRGDQHAICDGGRQQCRVDCWRHRQRLCADRIPCLAM